MNSCGIKFKGLDISNLKIEILKSKNAGVAQLVERQPSKLNVAGSNPVSRSKSHFCENRNLFQFWENYVEIVNSTLYAGVAQG